MYRIMSFDGGGVRGVYTVKLLEMLTKEHKLLESIQLLTGTSTGALIALGLALGYHPQQLIELYMHIAPLIFSKGSRGEDKARYQNAHLRDFFREHVFKGDPSLADIPMQVVIPAFKLYDDLSQSWRPICFHNFDRAQAKKHLVVDVALSACAAPLFFPSYQGYIDGGVFASNPSMMGLCQALRYDPSSPLLEDVWLFSLGTLWQPVGILQDVDWGNTSWIDPLFTLMTDGTIDVPHEQCEQLLGYRYHRLNTTADKVIAIDAVHEMSSLVETATRVPMDYSLMWEQTLIWLKEFIGEDMGHVGQKNTG